LNLNRLRCLSDVMPADCFTRMSSPATIRDLVKRADMVDGKITDKAVADAFGLAYTPIDSLACYSQVSG
jgi:hypothetical protein